MNRIVWFCWIGFLLVGSPVAGAEVRTQVVTYGGEPTLQGYLAYDDGYTHPRPGILVVHEWWGHNEYARERARMLAGLGYVALAVDMYGDGKQADHPEQASAFANAVMQDLDVAKARFAAAMDLLKGQPQTDGTRIAAIGYCFGGGVALQMAREGLDLAGVVSFHGSLATRRPARPGVVKAKLLVENGGADPFVPKDQIADFIREMDAAGVDYRFHSLPGAQHAFTNPEATGYGQRFQLPLRYDAEADRVSWSDMQAFFARLFP